MSETSQLLVRRFEATDADAVWELHNQALASTGAHAGNGPWDEDVRSPLSSYLARGGEFLVGFIGSEMVAMGAYIPIDTETVEIRRMRVAPSLQRKGLGRKLLEALETRAKGEGYSKVRLDTTREQLAAQELYRAAGYRKVASGRLGRFETVIFERELR